MIRQYGALLGAAALALVLGGAATAKLPAAGAVAPAWTGKTTTGKMISSAQFKGKPVLLNFFAYG